MIRIETKSYDMEAVRQSFLLEFTKMILCGMGIPREEETVRQAMAVLAEELEFTGIGSGFMVGNEDIDCDFDVQGCAFSVAEEVFGRNNYNDEFGGDQSCVTYVGERLLEQYPDLEFYSRTFLDREWSNTVEIVETVDGRIVTEIEEC